MELDKCAFVKYIDPMTPLLAERTEPLPVPISDTKGQVDRSPVPPYPLGQRLLFWLGQTCRQMREEAGIKMPAIAVILNRSDTKPLERLERAEHWPQSVEELLAAYGEVLDVDPRVFFVRALDDWQRYGEAPQLASTLPPPEEEAPPTAGEVIEKEAKALAQRRAANKDKRAVKRRASPKKKRGS